MSPDQFEQMILNFDEEKLIRYIMEKKYLKKELKCESCHNFMKLVEIKKNKDCFMWRCTSLKCKNYLKYYSIRSGSFFENFTISLKYIFRILTKYSCDSQRYNINRSIDLNEKTIRKVINKLVSLIPFTSFESNKLGGPQFTVQIDETMLNYKCKSHRGRSPSNKSDALCIVEVSDHITRAFACLIPNKKSETLIPIITNQVANGSTIWTDEHRSYTILRNFNYIHQTVCHNINL